MNGRYSLLADAANQSIDGKVNILGEFNVIFVPNFPALHPSLLYVASIEVGASDVGSQLFELRYVDADGNPVAPPFMIPVRIEFIGREHDGETQSHPIMVPIVGLGIRGPGRYSIELWSAGEQLTSCYFNAVLRPDAP